jgi:chemotaxis protein methyltransferase CheR
MPVSQEDIILFVNTVKAHSDYDFSGYSEKSLTRRVEKVLSDNKTDIAKLAAKLRNDKAFLEKVVRDITVNTTELFRDPKAWYALKYRILPKLRNNSTINIWHAGCSTGQEVYSMLILLYEMGLFDKANVYGTDLNQEVLDKARKGEYKYRFNINYLDNYEKVIKKNPYNFEEYNDIPFEKYFKIDKVSDTMQINDFLLKKPLFRKHDLVNQENIFYTKFDLILCRNVIIYFNYELQNKVFELFYNSLNDQGSLILGLHETILGAYTARFEKKGVYYRKKNRVQ